MPRGFSLPEEQYFAVIWYHTGTYRYIPKWNNIIIEQHLQRFITNISYNWGFETWLNLYRNKKYYQTLIDWELTFEILNTFEKSTEMSFTASNKKFQKLSY